MSRSLRYGRKSNPADVLELVRGADQLTVEAWPLVAASPDVARVAVTEHGPSSASVMHDHEVMAMARCPREHHYRDRLGVRGVAGAHEYGRFVRALRDGFTWLRTTHPAPGQAGSWADAEAALMGRWSEAWGEETPLEPFYRAEALRLYRRAYDRRGDEVTTTGVRLRKQYIVDVDNQAIAVHVDAVEERDGRTHLVWERVTSKGDDATSLTIALYGAVVQTAFQGVPATVEIRCLDGTDPPPVGDASRVLEQHRPLLRELMARAQTQQLPARPAKLEYCARCSFSFVCPGPARSRDTD